jgi:hypothetical protein
MYCRSEGVAQDYVRAHMLFNIAALNGENRALENRNAIAEQMSTEQIAKAQEMATRCMETNYQTCD